MDLEFDHVFAFVSPGCPEAGVLDAAGFSVLPARRHAGQGTANRSVLFDASYLELIHVASRPEAEAHELRLDRRADFATTGHCPFGIGLRALVPGEAQGPFVAYRPPWGTADYPPMLLHRGALARPGLPLVFVSQPPHGHDVASMRPGAWRRLDAAYLAHRNGVTGIATVEVTVPDPTGWPLDPPAAGVAVREGRTFHATVRLTGTFSRPLAVTPWLDLAPA